MKKYLFITLFLGVLIFINPAITQKKKKAGDDLQRLDKQLDAIKAPWTQGRVPVL